jgi:glycosyltransferase involved in cell wall biosynthesis
MKNITTEDRFPKKPTTSWVIRTLNEEKWLPKVLEALFAQSRLDFEVIIVDNESNDTTLAVLYTFPIRKVIIQHCPMVPLTKNLEICFSRSID